MTDSKTSEKWQETLELSLKQYFDPPFFMPHRGFIQLIRALEKEFGKETIHQTLQTTAERLFVAQTHEDITQNPVKDFRDFITRFCSPSGPFWGNALTGKVVESTDTTHVFHITECLWAKTYRDIGATDIGYLWNCAHDFPIAETAHPQIKLKRTKTLMQGDDCCDFRWSWEDE